MSFRNQEIIDYHSNEKLKFTNLQIFPTIHAQATPCADFEMRMIDCFEAYGMKKGYKKCFDFLYDLKECLNSGKKNQRIYLMREQHVSQYKKGERNEMYSKTPAHDAY